MRLSLLLQCAAAFSAVALLLIIHQQNKEGVEMARLASFLDRKVHVVGETLSETLGTLEQLEAKADETESLRRTLRDLNNKVAEWRANLTKCRQEKKDMEYKLQVALTERNQMGEHLEGERDVWTLELNLLKKQMSLDSKFCDFLSPASKKTTMLCKGDHQGGDSKQQTTVNLNS